MPTAPATTGTSTATGKRLWPRAIFWVALVGIGMGASGCADRLFYHPYGPAASLDGIHERLEQVWFRSATDGPLLHGIWLPALGQKRGTVVYCHGNTGNVGIQARNVTWLPKHGFDVLVFDYRGYGHSEGSPTREGTVLDAVAAIDLALAKDPDRTFVFGHSLGGAIGVVAAAERPAVRGVIAESAFASYRDIARNRASWVSWLVPLLVSGGFDPADSLASLPPRPVFVIHGAQDRIVPIRHGEELFDRALPPKRFHLAHRSGHATPWREEGAEFEQMLVQFFMETLERPDSDDLTRPLVPR